MKLRPHSAIVKFSWKNFIWIGGLHLLALAFVVPYFSWAGVIAFFTMYYLTGMVGITFGFHRLFTHKAFVVPTWLGNFAALCGTLACQGGPISWVASHRTHHMFSDKHEDPHDATRGFWHSHFIWVFNRRQDLDIFDDYKHYAPDMLNNKFVLFLENNMILIQVIFGLSLLAAGGIFGNVAGFDWHNAASLVVYGVFLRLVVIYHVTWFVNSAAHKWGSQPNNTQDLSRNIWWVALVSFGEGWHNNHHAQPRSARHGWTWWQFDSTWILIQILRVFGLVKNIKLPQQTAESFESAAPEAVRI